MAASRKDTFAPALRRAFFSATEAPAPGINRAAHSCPIGFGCLGCKGRDDTSNHFQLIPLDINGQRALNRLNRDHQLFCLVTQHNSFQTVEATSADSNPLPGIHKWMKREESILLEQQLQVFNLFWRHRYYDASKTYKADHPRSSQDGSP